MPELSNVPASLHAFTHQQTVVLLMPKPNMDGLLLVSICVSLFCHHSLDCTRSSWRKELLNIWNAAV